ncbi:hypothetical protein LN042_19755 [Kitasatospora sp. RB6PN24]|uniref:hypothetical protein n=1 Tax=Kitasatospora humi TaxID=2893891 RepID=UPI001E4CB63F|nr:hypothetical protein [Kitasatospora humi]MCC9309294.1 hypothetical protein [Kitasatospora humi]
MTWFAVSDSTDDHPKTLLAGNAALGLWVRCGAYASAHLTDGLIPGPVAAKCGTVAQIRKLVAAGLWHEAGHDCPRCPQVCSGDFVMHDYLHANPSRRQVLERRHKAALKKRQQRGGQGTGDPEGDEASGAGEGAAHGSASPGDSPRPRAGAAPSLPSRREGAGVGVHGPGGRARMRRAVLPYDFEPDVDSVCWAQQEGHLERLGGQAGLVATTQAFADWHRGQATEAADWQALWRKWVREQRHSPLAGTADKPAPAGGRRRSPKHVPNAADVSVTQRFADIEQLVAADAQPVPTAGRARLTLVVSQGSQERSAAPGRHPVMTALPGGQQHDADLGRVLAVIAERGQAGAVAEFGWRAVTEVLGHAAPGGA